MFSFVFLICSQCFIALPNDCAGITPPPDKPLKIFRHLILLPFLHENPLKSGKVTCNYTHGASLCYFCGFISAAVYNKTGIHE